MLVNDYSFVVTPAAIAGVSSFNCPTRLNFITLMDLYVGAQ
jgi:hypothetical protein